MKEMKKTEKDLLEVLRRGVSESVDIVEEIYKGLKECSSAMRVEQTDTAFSALSQGFTNLNHLIQFLGEVKKGVACLQGFDIPERPFSCWENSLTLFNEMHSSFKNRDWVTLADLIEYELDPLLQEGREGLIELRERLNAYSVV